MATVTVGIRITQEERDNLMAWCKAHDMKPRDLLLGAMTGKVAVPEAARERNAGNAEATATHEQLRLAAKYAEATRAIQKAQKAYSRLTLMAAQFAVAWRREEMIHGPKALSPSGPMSSPVLSLANAVIRLDENLDLVQQRWVEKDAIQKRDALILASRAHIRWWILDQADIDL